MELQKICFTHFGHIPKIIELLNRYSNALTAGLNMALKKYHTFAILVGFLFFIMYGSYALRVPTIVSKWANFWRRFHGKLSFWIRLFTHFLLKCKWLDKIISKSCAWSLKVFFSVLIGAMSLGNAIPFLSTISTAQGCGAVVFNIVDSMPDIDPYDKRGIMPDIIFRDVCFRYPSRPTLPVQLKFFTHMNFSRIEQIITEFFKCRF